jgi:hypothetical protein
MNRSTFDERLRVTTWLAATAICTAMAGCGPSASEATTRPVVYVCTETREAFHLPSQPTPATNPKTGKPTLVQGLYCSKCDKWYPTPPLDAVGGNPGAITCPVHRSALVADGPEPAAPAADENP